MSLPLTLLKLSEAESGRRRILRVLLCEVGAAPSGLSFQIHSYTWFK